MRKFWTVLAAAGCVAIVGGVVNSGEQLALRLTNNTNKAAKVEISRGKDASCAANAAFDTLRIAPGQEAQVPFDDHLYVCWRVDGGADGESGPWRAKSCSLEKPDCSAVLAQ